MSMLIYHITHISNLANIITAGELWSDRRMQQENMKTVIGFGHIKRRRLTEIKVSCHPETMVGDYVPFYFCPRSVMLYVIYRGNNSELEYKDGQQRIVHLVATVQAAVDVAGDGRWAYSDGNAGAV